MARDKGTANLAASLEVLAGAPLDSRTIVPALVDLTNAANFPYSYVGMVVAVQATGDLYMLINNDVTVSGNWKKVSSGNEIVDGYYNSSDKLFYKESSYTTLIDGESNKIYVSLDTNKTYRYNGSLHYYVRLDYETIDYFQKTVMPPADGITHGKVYQYIGETTADFVHNYFYECFLDPSPTSPRLWYWERVDVQPDEDTKIQVEVMPTVTSADEGKIVQYIGVTDTDYTNGFFYECVSDGAGGYEWELKEVQPGGSGGGSIENPMTASVNVGGITIGKSYPAGTSMEQMWQDLIDPIQYPTLTAPSASVSIPGDKILETGATASKTVTVTFNRGSISPAYGTSGYRSGAADTYALNGGTAQSGNTFTETVSESNKTFQATVTYLAGEQPKDSKGNNYSTPLAAGSVNSNTITYEFVDAIWANTSDITSVAKLGLVSKSAKVKEFNFPAQTVANPEEFHVPASWTVTAVAVLNTLSNQWESCAGEFTVGTTTHNDAAGNTVNYATYTDNRGYAAAARKVRVKWS